MARSLGSYIFDDMGKAVSVLACVIFTLVFFKCQV